MSDQPSTKGLIDVARNYITLYQERCATPSRKNYTPYDWTTSEVLNVMVEVHDTWGPEEQPVVIERVMARMCELAKQH